MIFIFDLKVSRSFWWSWSLTKIIKNDLFPSMVRLHLSRLGLGEQIRLVVDWILSSPLQSFRENQERSEVDSYGHTVIRPVRDGLCRPTEDSSPKWFTTPASFSAIKARWILWILSTLDEKPGWNFTDSRVEPFRPRPPNRETASKGAVCAQPGQHLGPFRFRRLAINHGRRPAVVSSSPHSAVCSLSLATLKRRNFRPGWKTFCPSRIERERESGGRGQLGISSQA